MTDEADLEEFLKQEIKAAIGASRRNDIDFLSGKAARVTIARLKERNLLDLEVLESL